MKIFFKGSIICGLALVMLSNITLSAMESSKKQIYEMKDCLLKRFVGMEGKLGALERGRLTDFVTFSLQQVDAMRQLLMNNEKCNIEFLKALAHNETLFEQSRDKFIRLDEKLFNLHSIFESLQKENLLHIVDVVPNLRKIVHYLEQLENLKQEDSEFWPILLAVDEDADSLVFTSLDEGFMDRLENLWAAVVDFENALSREQVRSGECFDDGGDDAFYAKDDRRDEYARKFGKRKLRRAGASSKSHR